MPWIRGYSAEHIFFHIMVLAACFFLPWWIQRPDDESVMFSELRQISVGHCVSLPGAEDVFVVMKTGATVLRERLPIHFETTFKCIPEYIIYSDATESFHGHKIHDVLSQIDGNIKSRFPSDFVLYDRLHDRGSSALTSNQGWKLDKWKFLPIMKSALDARPHAKWFFFIEDDTAIVWSNVLSWLEPYDSNQIYYFGREEKVANRPFAHGGSGYVLSNAALRQAVDYMMSRMEKYFNLTKEVVYGDISASWMLSDAGLPLINTWPSFQGESPGKLQYTEQIWCRPVVTHHHMSAQDIALLWALEQRTIALEKANNKVSVSLLHRDVFNALIRPQLSLRLDNWDNGRGDEKPSETLAECQALCKADETCLQFRFASGQCRLASRVRLGSSTESRFGITSGWMLDRIDRLYGAFIC